VVIYRFNRPFNICIVVPDFDVLAGRRRQKASHRIKALAERPEVVEMLSQTITRHLQGKFDGYEIPKRFLVLSEPFSLNNGMLTQTMKLKHNIVLDKLKDQIEALYQAAAS